MRGIIVLLFLIFSTAVYSETAKIDLNQKMTDEQLMQKTTSIIEVQQKKDPLNITQPTIVIETPEVKLEISKIEEQYNKRIDIISKKINLKQFGYDFFKKDVKTDYILPISESYRLGPGDTISFYLWGDPVEILGLNGFYTLEIGRDGKVFVPNLGAIYLWGMSVSEAKETFRRLLSKKFKKFELELTLGKIRNFPVYITGEVNKQGIVFANGTNSVLDVLVLAGGVKKTGTLRDIVVKRNENGKIIEHHIDLYSILIFGEPVNLVLKEGDSLYVKPIGATVAMLGGVKKEGIYELREGESAKDVLKYAGGLLPTTNIELVTILTLNNNKQSLVSVNYKKFEELKIRDGDIVYFPDVNYLLENKVSVSGTVRYPGNYAIEENNMLSKILKKVYILPETNLYYGQIFRKDLVSGKDMIINFVPIDILNGKGDIELKPFDSITFYNKNLFQPIEISGEVEEALVIPYYKNMTVMDAIRNLKFKYSVRELKLEVYESSDNVEGNAFDNVFDNVFDNAFDNVSTNMVYNKFDSRDRYKNNFVDTSTSVPYSKADSKGKFKNKIETNSIVKMNIIYLYDLLNKGDKNQNITLKPGSKILVKKVEPTEKDKSITILGEVSKPGTYKYKSGMTLYDLIKEAGGYTEDAYPKSLIFIRESAKRLQYEQLKLTMISMEESLAKNSEAFKSAAGSSEEEKLLLQMVLEKQKKTLDLIRTKAEIGLGRVALDVPEDLEDLKKSNQNIELQDGDYIYIPAKPSYVLVLGSVYNQVSLPYSNNKTVKDYIEEVGGVSKDADEKDIYVIKANGKVISQRNVRDSFFGGGFYSMKLDQGDTVVIPQDVKVPTLWRPLLKDITQIIFQTLSTAILAKRL